MAETTPPDAPLTTAAQVLGVLQTDPRVPGWKVIDRAVDFLEIERDGVFLVLVWPEHWQRTGVLERHLIRARTGNYALLLFGTDGQWGEAEAAALDASKVFLMPIPISTTRLVMGIRNAGDFGQLRRNTANVELALDRAHYENAMFLEVGRALSQQRDLDSLLAIILRRAREVTGADAGSIYVVEGEDDESQRTLRFKVAQNDSIDSMVREATAKDFTMPVSSSSIVGLCVLTGEDINIPDLYTLDPPGVGNNPWGFVHDRSFDDRHGYQTRSMMTVPMISAREQVIGVIQLINKRASGQATLGKATDFTYGVIPFDDVSVQYAKTLASQAGIALENAMLYAEVKTLFEGFVRASVTAIEAREPATRGHSERVARLTVGLAEVVDKVDRGPFADKRFDRDDLVQIEYAALLHDFGKVGVREQVLVKAAKLYPWQCELIWQRLDYIKQGVEADVLRDKLDYALKSARDLGMDAVDRRFAELDAKAQREFAKLDCYRKEVMQANKPALLEREVLNDLAEIARHYYIDGQGVKRPYLTPEEVDALQVLRGSLTSDERVQIQAHVSLTEKFLRQIPWGRNLRNIPNIAGAHHEKLDGSGYPKGRSGDAIPIEARMMTISDIFDALTAHDRPYKSAVPLDRALDILHAEVKAGQLDEALFRLFVDAEIYNLSDRCKR